uniref:Uncharacterized protein n=1 Tax=Arion vulgaris TaxID=1028688 RepID=A0A0B6YMB1_9EUPU
MQDLSKTGRGESRMDGAPTVILIHKFVEIKLQKVTIALPNFDTAIVYSD